MSIRNTLLILLIFYLTSFASFGQSRGQGRALRAADEAFNSLQYNTAAVKYKKAYSRTRNKADKEQIIFKMAECYRLMNQNKKAEPTYKRLVKTQFAQKNPIVFLYLAQAMMINEKYEAAQEWFERYIEFTPDDLRGKNGLESCKLAQEWLKSPTKYQFQIEKQLNSKESEFSPVYADRLYNTLIFTSTREASTGKGTDNWTGQSFSDLYITKKDPNGKWSVPVLLETNGTVNTEANEGAACLNGKFNQLYFTRCLNDKGTLQGCKIMVSRRSGRNWGDPIPLELGGDSTNVFGQPALSPDELFLFFSSDLKGGKGGKDLWMATRKSTSDNFGRPINLGDEINTTGDEMFPFMRNDSTLYFSSNGHPGLGGLDIYKSTYSNGKWTTPVNVQVPLNSSADDFSIIFNPESDEGYLASNRRGGRGSDDLYSFVNPPVLFTLAGVVKDDKTLQPVQGAVVKLTGSDGSSLEARTDAKGAYSFNKNQIKARTTYELLCNKTGYFNKKARETTVGQETSKDYVINFSIEPIPDKPVVLPDILYDLAKWDLKPQYQDSLQGLIKTLDENETIIIELASHTDNRGSDESNDILSQKRAESVVNYLIERGIDPERLVAKGYGEKAPRTLNKDYTKEGYTFKQGTTLTGAYIDSLPSKPIQEAAHALNRRTEFRILSKDYVPKTRNKALPGQRVEVQINPDDNAVPFTENIDGSIKFQAIVNGYTLDVVYSENAAGLTFSDEQTLKLLKDGALGKTDFAGDAEKIIGNNSIQDKAVFNVAEITLGKKSVYDMEASVDAGQASAVVINKKMLTRISNFEINKDRKLLILK